MGRQPVPDACCSGCWATEMPLPGLEAVNTEQNSQPQGDGGKVRGDRAQGGWLSPGQQIKGQVTLSERRESWWLCWGTVSKERGERYQDYSPSN